LLAYFLIITENKKMPKELRHFQSIKGK